MVLNETENRNRNWVYSTQINGGFAFQTILQFFCNVYLERRFYFLDIEHSRTCL